MFCYRLLFCGTFFLCYASQLRAEPSDQAPVADLQKFETVAAEASGSAHEAATQAEAARSAALDAQRAAAEAAQAKRDLEGGRDQDGINGISTMLPIGADPTVLTVPRTAVAASLSASEKGTVLAFAVRPAKVFNNLEPHLRWLKGFTLSTTYRTDTKVATFGGGYQFKAMWIFAESFMSDLRGTKGACQGLDYSCLDGLWYFMVPSVYLGFDLGLFSLDREKFEQNLVSRKMFSVKFEERATRFVEVTQAWTVGEETVSTDPARNPAGQFSLSTTVVLVAPLLGGTASDYDKTGFMTGIGFGATATIKECLGNDTPAADCASKAPYARHERTFGGVLDFRYKAPVVPRLVISQTRLEGEQAGAPFVVEGPSFELQLSSSLSR